MRNRDKNKKSCYFTDHNIKHIDYRDVHLLNKFINSHGKIIARKRTGVCAKYQKKLEGAIKNARYMALMPYIKK